MSERTMVCGAAFEDLNYDEMMELDGAASPTIIVATLTYFLAGGCVGLSVGTVVKTVFK